MKLGRMFEISIKDLVKMIAQLMGPEDRLARNTSKPNG
jgi:hypothetical protein